jgi:uncharacterized protein
MCSAPLQAVERQSVPIDFCPQCKGFWLDEGELDEIVRTEAAEALVRGQELIRKRRGGKAYDKLDHDAPAPAPPLDRNSPQKETRP